MSSRILIMGLPGSGKTTLSLNLLSKLHNCHQKVKWINADDVRNQYNDWDFSIEGRIRQSIRMRKLADSSVADYVIADFVAPLEEMRNNYKADYTIWVDTIQESRYADTNAMFQKPEVYDFHITEKDAGKWSAIIADYILKNKGEK